MERDNNCVFEKTLHDTATAGSLAMMEVLEHLVREEERNDLRECCYIHLKAGMETFWTLLGEPALSENVLADPTATTN